MIAADKVIEAVPRPVAFGRELTKPTAPKTVSTAVHEVCWFELCFTVFMTVLGCTAWLMSTALQQTKPTGRCREETID
jgi:hypothetical protein